MFARVVKSYGIINFHERPLRETGWTPALRHDCPINRLRLFVLTATSFGIPVSSLICFTGWCMAINAVNTTFFIIMRHSFRVASPVFSAKAGIKWHGNVCLEMFGCLQAERTIAIRKRKFLNNVIHNALCRVFVAIAKTELESCCTDV